MKDGKKGAGTALVEGGRRKEWRGRIVNPPVERASTILFDSVAELRANKPGLGIYRYGLQGTATHWALAEALTELEPGAAGTALYSSGLAAITAPLMAVLSAGDELLVTDSVYGPTRIFCDTILKRFGVSTRYFDPLAGEAISDSIGESTRAILLESPGSLTMEVQDVPAISAVARERGIVTLLDNTWATPLLFPALSAGIDISIVAGTKYVGGHADVMLGYVAANDSHAARLVETHGNMGLYASGDDCFLGLRGLRTLPVRLARHQQTGIALAQWLAARPEVARVMHPALPGDAGHALWKRDFSGACGLFGLVLKPAPEKAVAAMLDGLSHFGMGYSWGGFESLIIPSHIRRTARPWTAEGPVLRVHAGLEDAGDLIADLEKGFARLKEAT
jgi:cystathionine beta-lyase